MPAETERMDIRKAMAYDLLCIFKQDTEKTYTFAELEKLIDDYISGSRAVTPVLQQSP